MELVVNEWLPDWLTPHCSRDEFKKANNFLHKFYEKNDILVVKFDSRFREKLMQFSKQYSGYPEYSRKLGFVINEIIWNSQKCRLLYDDEIQPLHQSVDSLLTPPFDSDKYLFEAAYTSQDKIVITTDLRLIEQTRNNNLIRIVHFEDFIRDY